MRNSAPVRSSAARTSGRIRAARPAPAVGFTRTARRRPVTGPECMDAGGESGLPPSFYAEMRNGGHMRRPKRIWWARNKKLCALERPGGGGRTHRPDRRKEEIAYLKKSGVRLVISTARTRHNIAAYEKARLDWHHAPVRSWDDAEAVLEELL